MDAQREQVSASLRRRLDEAHAAYRRATDEYNRLMSISRATSHPDDPGLVDGTYAMRQAIRLHREARLKYACALEVFTDFVLHGKWPADSPPATHTEAVATSVDALTPREIEVLKLIALGLTSRDIAAHLGISFKTAVTHRTRIMDKLNLHDVASVVRYAIRQNLIEA